MMTNMFEVLQNALSENSRKTHLRAGSSELLLRQAGIRDSGPWGRCFLRTVPKRAPMSTKRTAFQFGCTSAQKASIEVTKLKTNGTHDTAHGLRKS